MAQFVEERLVQIDGRHPRTGLAGKQQRAAAGTAAQIEHAGTRRQRPGEGEQSAGGGVGAGTLPRKAVVQGEEGVMKSVVGQRGNP
ncbi:hypothetical protein [Streptomyces sp. NPDC001820]|uniref:hypothetical protein n=1 Tax=Streptomyces sp. NPDC001820 TaxID=3364613 RepID=UPI0036A013F5